MPSSRKMNTNLSKTKQKLQDATIKSNEKLKNTNKKREFTQRLLLQGCHTGLGPDSGCDCRERSSILRIHGTGTAPAGWPPPLSAPCFLSQHSDGCSDDGCAWLTVLRWRSWTACMHSLSQTATWCRDLPEAGGAVRESGSAGNAAAFLETDSQGSWELGKGARPGWPGGPPHKSQEGAKAESGMHCFQTPRIHPSPPPKTHTGMQCYK